MLGCVGRGGNAQAIRDEILNIMHRNHIGEKRGTWMEVPTFTHSAAHCSAFGRHTAAVLCLSCNQKGIHTVQLGSYSSSCTLTHYSLAASTNCLCAVKSALLSADCRHPTKGSCPLHCEWCHDGVDATLCCLYCRTGIRSCTTTRLLMTLSSARPS